MLKPHYAKLAGKKAPGTLLQVRIGKVLCTIGWDYALLGMMIMHYWVWWLCTIGYDWVIMQYWVWLCTIGHHYALLGMIEWLCTIGYPYALLGIVGWLCTIKYDVCHYALLGIRTIGHSVIMHHWAYAPLGNTHHWAYALLGICTIGHPSTLLFFFLLTLSLASTRHSCRRPQLRGHPPHHRRQHSHPNQPRHSPISTRHILRYSQ